MPKRLLDGVGMTTNEFIGERTRERDRFELEVGDAFVVKASTVLVILTFLGTISGHDANGR